MSRILIIAALGLSGCATFDAEEFDFSYNLLAESAAQYMEQQQYAQAIIVSRTLMDAVPDNPAPERMLAQALAAAPGLSTLVHKNLLGTNLKDRTGRDLPLWGRLVLYPLHRATDFMDLVSVELGLCFGLGARAGLTDAFAAGAQISFGEIMIGLDRRHLSLRATLDEFIEVLMLESRQFVESRASTGGAYALPYAHIGVKRPSSVFYQRARDYWRVGAQAEVLFFAVNVQFHPVEFWDFLMGFFLLEDPLYDDVGMSARVELKARERDAMVRLARQVRYRP